MITDTQTNTDIDTHIHRLVYIIIMYIVGTYILHIGI